MKRIFRVLSIFLVMFLLVGCTKNYKPITYTKFIENFSNRGEFVVNNDTEKYEDRFERYIQAVGINTETIYYEFKTEEAARKYMIDNYKNSDDFKLKDKKKYITVEYKKSYYFYAIQVDKIVITSSTPIAKNKSEVKGIFKELGY